MSTLNWFNASVAVGLGVLVGVVIYLWGSWMDGRTDREAARLDTDDKPLPVQVVRQHDNEENDRA